MKKIFGLILGVMMILFAGCVFVQPYTGAPGEIRYEKKSIVFLWINIYCLVFHHHPNDIDHLSA